MVGVVVELSLLHAESRNNFNSIHALFSVAGTLTVSLLGLDSSCGHHSLSNHEQYQHEGNNCE
jgi:hypothetical protein